jgi:hypothetical protein
MRGAIVRGARESLSTTTLVSWEQQVLHPEEACLLGPSRRMRQTYVFANGSEIDVFGLKASGHSNAAKYMGSEYDLIFVDEANEADVEDLQRLLTRLSHARMPYAQLLLALNPQSPNHPIYSFVDTQSEVHRVYLSDAEHFMRPEYRAILDKLTGSARERLVLGKRAASEGLVYSDYMPEFHIIPAFPIPTHWDRVVGIDFGFTHPFAAVFCALDEDDRMYVYRQYLRTQATLRMHMEVLSQYRDEVCVAVCDHAAGDVAELSYSGWPTYNAVKDVMLNKQRLMDRLRLQPDGRARVYLMADTLLPESNAPGLETELLNHKWDKSGNMPEKTYDHALNALEYLCAYVDTQRVSVY